MKKIIKARNVKGLDGICYLPYYHGSVCHSDKVVNLLFSFCSWVTLSLINCQSSGFCLDILIVSWLECAYVMFALFLFIVFFFYFVSFFLCFALHLAAACKTKWIVGTRISQFYKKQQTIIFIISFKSIVYSQTLIILSMN